jgi:hypothetical protein
MGLGVCDECNRVLWCSAMKPFYVGDHAEGCSQKVSKNE